MADRSRNLMLRNQIDSGGNVPRLPDFNSFFIWLLAWVWLAISLIWGLLLSFSHSVAIGAGILLQGILFCALLQTLAHIVESLREIKENLRN